jgi:hypothetical protein
MAENLGALGVKHIGLSVLGVHHGSVARKLLIQVNMSTWKVLNSKLGSAELLIASTPHLVGGGLQSSYT